MFVYFFFFKQKTAYEMRISDWSSDVCSSDLLLMRYVGTAFDDLRRGMEIVSNRRVTLLRLHSAPSFAAQWLTPRLSDFFAKHPDIEVRLAASTDYARFSNDDFDLDIVYGAPRIEGLHVVPLGEEIDRKSTRLNSSH